MLSEWWYGPVVCKVAPYLQNVVVSASVNTLAAIALERSVKASFFIVHSSWFAYNEVTEKNKQRKGC